MDYEQIKKAAEGYKADMARFLRAMISHPSESCEEKGVAHRIAERQAISPRFEGRARRARLRPDDEGQFIPPPFTGNRGRNRTRFELRDLIGLRFRLIVGLVVRTGGETAQRNATQKRR